MPDLLFDTLLEVGGGKGILTKHLFEKYNDDVCVVEIDDEAASYLKNDFPDFADRIICADFLKFDLANRCRGKIGIIGNFPYNISSQILFKALENRKIISFVYGMYQLEVAERLQAEKGSKKYGILSVLLQTFFEVKLLFRVPPSAFLPRPKVNSAVVQITPKEEQPVDLNDSLLFSIVKAAFNQRRKTLKNALSGFAIKPEFFKPFSQMRAEQLSVDNYIQLTKNCMEIKQDV